MIRFATLVFAALFCASAAFAFGAPKDDFGKALVVRIRHEGYRVTSVKTTLFGRVQIQSKSSSYRRQTVYSPASEVILQDVYAPLEHGESLMSELADLLGVDLRAARNGGAGKGKWKPPTGAGNGKGKGKQKENNGKALGKDK